MRTIKFTTNVEGNLQIKNVIVTKQSHSRSILEEEMLVRRKNHISIHIVFTYILWSRTVDRMDYLIAQRTRQMCIEWFRLIAVRKRKTQIIIGKHDGRSSDRTMWQLKNINFSTFENPCKIHIFGRILFINKINVNLLIFVIRGGTGYSQFGIS